MGSSKKETKTLNLGCGNYLIGGDVLNHDRIKHRPEIDVAWDLNDLPWPWEDNRFKAIVARAVLEHLDIDLLTAVNECWRIMQVGGELSIKLPYWNNEAAYDDPTHRYVVGRGVFDLFDPTTKRGAQYDFYTDRKWKLTKVALNNCKSAVWAWMTKIDG